MVAATNAFASVEQDPEIIELGEPDVPEMLALVAATRAGPFWPRSHETGTFLGAREASPSAITYGKSRDGWTLRLATSSTPCWLRLSVPLDDRQLQRAPVAVAPTLGGGATATVQRRSDGG